MLAFCLAEVRGSQKWGVGVVENLEPGVILAEGKSYLFSPDYEKIGPLPLRRQGSFSIK